MRQLLSIALALVLGVAGFEHFFAGRKGTPRTSAPAAIAFAVSTVPPPIVAPTPQDLCVRVQSGYYPSGRPIGGYLWQLMIANHPECFRAGPGASPATGPTDPR